MDCKETAHKHVEVSKHPSLFATDRFIDLTCEPKIGQVVLSLSYFDPTYVVESLFSKSALRC